MLDKDMEVERAPLLLSVGTYFQQNNSCFTYVGGASRRHG